MRQRRLRRSNCQEAAKPALNDRMLGPVPALLEGAALRRRLQAVHHLIVQLLFGTLDVTLNAWRAEVVETVDTLARPRIVGVVPPADQAQLGSDILQDDTR